MADLEITIGSELSNASYSSISERRESVADNIQYIYKDSIEGIEEEFTPSDVNDTIRSLYLALHPVGDIVMNDTGENPGDLYGGVWELFGPGRTLIGVDYMNPQYKKANMQDGKKFDVHRHTLAGHTHKTLPHTHGTEHTHGMGKHTHILKPHVHNMQHRHAFQHTHEFYHSHLQSIGWEGENQYFISSTGNMELTETQEEPACYWKVSKKFDIGRQVPRAFASWNTISFSYLPDMYLGEMDTSFTGEAQVPYRESKDKTKHTIPNYTTLETVDSSAGIKNDIGDTNPKTASGYLSTLQPYVVCYIFRRIA